MNLVNIFLRLTSTGFVLLIALTATNARASALSVGDLLIYRVGTGSGGLVNTATAVFLDEYTPLGTFVQSIALPTTGSAALTAVGSDATEGIMTVSPYGSIIFTGYRADVGAANPSLVDPATVNRVVGRINYTGVADTSIAVTDATGTIRSAIGSDGPNWYYLGTSTGLRYIGSPSGSSTSTLLDPRNHRQVALANNSLTLVSSSTQAGSTAKVQSYGDLPTSAVAGTTIVATSLTDAINGFALFDLSPGVAGVDTLYALSTAFNRLYKYTFDGSSWALNNYISAGGAANLAGIASGSTVNLFLTSATTLYTETDSSGYNANITGSLSAIATAGANTAFRGIVVVPEPSTVSLGLLAAATLLALRRRR